MRAPILQSFLWLCIQGSTIYYRSKPFLSQELHSRVHRPLRNLCWLGTPSETATSSQPEASGWSSSKHSMWIVKGFTGTGWVWSYCIHTPQTFVKWNLKEGIILFTGTVRKIKNTEDNQSCWWNGQVTKCHLSSKSQNEQRRAPVILCTVLSKGPCDWAIATCLDPGTGDSCRPLHCDDLVCVMSSPERTLQRWVRRLQRPWGQASVSGPDSGWMYITEPLCKRWNSKRCRIFAMAYQRKAFYSLFLQRRASLNCPGFVRCICNYISDQQRGDLLARFWSIGIDQ